MSRPKDGRRWLATGAAALLVLVAAHTWPTTGTFSEVGRGARFERASEPQAIADASTVRAAIEDVAGGWRPKRPMVCAGAMILSAMAGAAVNVVAPGGGGVVLVAMLPFLLDACQ